MRKEVYITLVATLVIWIQFGCEPNSFTQRSKETNNPSPVKHEPYADVGPDRTFLMGSFNIRDFGVSKIGKNSIAPILVDIGRKFDLLAIQELSNVTMEVMPKYLDMLNANGMNYQYVLGPRQGVTRFKEQYVYIYDANKFEVIGTSFVAPDPNGKMSRSPFVTSFRSIETTPDKAITFSLFNVHTDYDVVTSELVAMQDIVQNVVRQMPYEDDFIVLGDFNAPPRHFSQYPVVANQVSVIPDDMPTNLRGDRNYDNIIFNAQTTREYRGNYGVLDVMKTYELSYEQAKYVSDHLPIWAEFSIYETQSPAVAASVGTEVVR